MEDARSLAAHLSRPVDPAVERTERNPFAGESKALAQGGERDDAAEAMAEFLDPLDRC